MLTPYDGEPHIFTGPDGGFLFLENGQPIMEQGLENALYVSLVARRFWGNAVAREDEQVDSRLHEIISTATLSDVVLLNVQEEVKRLLAWMIRQKIVQRFEVVATAETLNLVRLAITIFQPLRSVLIVYGITWDQQRLKLEQVES